MSIDRLTPKSAIALGLGIAAWTGVQLLQTEPVAIEQPTAAPAMATWEVTITNLTRGQILSPPVVWTHDRHAALSERSLQRKRMVDRIHGWHGVESRRHWGSATAQGHDWRLASLADAGDLDPEHVQWPQHARCALWLWQCIDH